MSHQFSIIKHNSYYLYRHVIYLDYPADEPVVSTLISLFSLYQRKDNFPWSVG